MRRTAAALIAATLALPVLAAAPNDRAMGDIDGEYELTVGEPVSHEGPQDTGGVNVWTHMSLWDGNSCHNESISEDDPVPDNKCDRILFHVLEDGEATITITENYAISDYDLVVYESGKSGDAFTAIGHNQNEVFLAGEGPIPVPGSETVTFEADADMYYLAVVFYRAAGGGYTMDASLV